MDVGIAETAHGKVAWSVLLNMKMDAKNNLASTMVFTPTITSYFLICVDKVALGVSICLLFYAAAHRIGVFDELKKWPRISRLTLAASPILIGTGFFFSFGEPTYVMAIPGLIYTVLSMLGGIALK